VPSASTFRFNGDGCALLETTADASRIFAGARDRPRMRQALRERLVSFADAVTRAADHSGT
jgi:hypothetical protein